MLLQAFHAISRKRYKEAEVKDRYMHGAIGVDDNEHTIADIAKAIGSR